MNSLILINQAWKFPHKRKKRNWNDFHIQVIACRIENFGLLGKPFVTSKGEPLTRILWKYYSGACQEGTEGNGMATLILGHSLGHRSFLPLCALPSASSFWNQRPPMCITIHAKIQTCIKSKQLTVIPSLSPRCILR